MSKLYQDTVVTFLGHCVHLLITNMVTISYRLWRFQLWQEFRWICWCVTWFLCGCWDCNHNHNALKIL